MDERELMVNFINVQVRLLEAMRHASDPYLSPEADALQLALMDVVDLYEMEVGVYCFDPQSIDVIKVQPMLRAWQESWYGRL